MKWRLLDCDTVIDRGRFRHDDPPAQAALPGPATPIDVVWIASVASAERDRELAARIQARWRVTPQFAVTPARAADLVNSYPEPSRLGIDRWLVMLGARARSRQRLCVLDAGSAVTIDLVAADGRHEGGYILPGLDLMERSLLAGTGRVRFEGARSYALQPGCDTRSAVHHGAALAVCGALDAALARAAESGPAPELFLCGGDASQLRPLIGHRLTLCEDLLFEGLGVHAREWAP